jgi:hypothetical protein
MVHNLHKFSSMAFRIMLYEEHIPKVLLPVHCALVRAVSTTVVRAFCRPSGRLGLIVHLGDRVTDIRHRSAAPAGKWYPMHQTHSFRSAHLCYLKML